MSQEISGDAHQIAINAIRFLSVDMVETAKSGHPGAPMGQAALAYALWTNTLRFDPATPDWPNRDRFVLSCGHASALIYALLHLAGYDLPMEELKNFRQLHSKTPGHPEYGHTPGVETTTGPLGQGISNAVGMAIAERLLADRFNQPDFELFNNTTWVLASDGDLMEGVSCEASSLAGHLGLGKLNVLYDDNLITIDGSTDLSFSEDVCKRYESYGWHTLVVDDGNDLDAVNAAIAAAKAETERPTLVRVRTVIGFGAPNKKGTSGVHGSPLGADEIVAAKENLGWPLEPMFHVPDEARAAFTGAVERGAAERADWEALLAKYAEAHPELAAELDRRRRGELPEGWVDAIPSFTPEDGNLATRKSSGAVLNAIAEHLPELVGGSADLAPSNNTFLKGKPVFSRDTTGPNFHFGVREHAMGSVMNGMVLSGLLRPYGGTFLIFTDYMRPAMRLAALMGQPTIYVMTHDSIFLGEDGPTHQPISQLVSMRSIPNMVLLRPGDANETAAAWRVAIERREGPTTLALTRQGLPTHPETAEKATDGVARGAYVLVDCKDPQAILIATGSELAIAREACETLARDGVGVRLVSMPSWELFAAQDADYRESVLPASVTKRLAVEAGSPLGWHRWVGTDGDVLAMEGFGASAPIKDLKGEFGFTAENVVARLRSLF